MMTPAKSRPKRPPRDVLVRRWAILAAALLTLILVGVVVADATASTPRHSTSAASRRASADTKKAQSERSACPPITNPLPGMPPVTDPCNIYAADTAGNLTGPAKNAIPMIYVPNGLSNSVTEINPATYQVVRTFPTGFLPQHVVPSYDLSTLWVTNDGGNSLTPIDPTTGLPGPSVPVEDPYNMYFTPNGQYAIVVAEALDKLDFRNPHTMALVNSVPVDCPGVDHMDFSADGTYLIASCEFSGQLLKVNVETQQVVGRLFLGSSADQPQDVKLSPDGKTFYVADQHAGGLWEVNGATFTVTGFLPTGAGAHGLYVSRNAKYLYVSDRAEGAVSVVDFATKSVVATWQLPPEPGAHLGSPNPSSPDMGGVSDDGNVLWLSGRYNSDVYAIDTNNGQLLARIPVGDGPHGVCVWPQPGRYSIGHTGIMR